MRIFEISPKNEHEYDSGFLNTGDYECFLKIHTPSCGFCKQLEPEWKKLEEFAEPHSKNDVYIVSLDANAKDKFNIQSDVHGYPTIIYLNKDGSVKNEYKDGDRSFEKLKDFLFAQSPPMMFGGKKRKSRKNKSRKHKSRKNKSRKHKSRKHKSRKNKSRKNKSRKY